MGVKMGKSRTKTPTDARMTPGAKALAAAYQLQRDGKRISVKAAAELAKVDRSHLTNVPDYRVGAGNSVCMI
jgi:hypothetical protein